MNFLILHFCVNLVYIPTVLILVKYIYSVFLNPIILERFPKWIKRISGKISNQRDNRYISSFKQKMPFLLPSDLLHRRLEKVKKFIQF